MNIGTIRKRLVGSLLALCIGLLAPYAASAPAPNQRTLTFYNTHTEERVSVVYFSEGRYRSEGLARIDRFLRDHRTNDVHQVDIALLDLLHELYKRSHSRGEFQVISGYRSPQTNHMLRTRSTGVSKKSLHMRGQAIDVRLSDVDTWRLRQIAVAINKGGVGYYHDADFVHVDVGSVRTW